MVDSDSDERVAHSTVRPAAAVSTKPTSNQPERFVKKRKVAEPAEQASSSSHRPAQPIPDDLVVPVNPDTKMMTVPTSMYNLSTVWVCNVAIVLRTSSVSRCFVCKVCS